MQQPRFAKHCVPLLSHRDERLRVCPILEMLVRRALLADRGAAALLAIRPGVVVSAKNPHGRRESEQSLGGGVEVLDGPAGKVGACGANVRLLKSSAQARKEGRKKAHKKERVAHEDKVAATQANVVWRVAGKMHDLPAELAALEPVSIDKQLVKRTLHLALFHSIHHPKVRLHFLDPRSDPDQRNATELALDVASGGEVVRVCVRLECSLDLVLL